jgi:hypothetical protein
MCKIFFRCFLGIWVYRNFQTSHEKRKLEFWNTDILRKRQSGMCVACNMFNYYFRWLTREMCMKFRVKCAQNWDFYHKSMATRPNTLFPQTLKDSIDVELCSYYRAVYWRLTALVCGLDLSMLLFMLSTDVLTKVSTTFFTSSTCI